MRTVEAVVAEVLAPELEQEHGRAFASLRIPSFRWWFVAQIFSGSAMMAQLVGQAWLVLHVLHGGGVALGACPRSRSRRFSSAAPGRARSWSTIDVRKILIATQIAAGAVAATSGCSSRRVSCRCGWSSSRGRERMRLHRRRDPRASCTSSNLVGRHRVASAVGLYEVIINASRVIGPAIGGRRPRARRESLPAYFVNAASYVVPLVVLLLYRPHYERTTDDPGCGHGTRSVPGSPTCAGRRRLRPAC